MAIGGEDTVDYEDLLAEDADISRTLPTADGGDKKMNTLTNARIGLSVRTTSGDPRMNILALFIMTLGITNQITRIA